MSSIRILHDRVANQIAAGEVIERPVAVIKELVENSIDAGATRIEVEYRNGGKSYMRVEDNGRGMNPDETLLCLERHATSKIREASDLKEVSTFGFRGEALPSIASVSRFTLRSRSVALPYGTEVQINGGKLLNKKECGMPVGTVIEVSQLFNSVPARRKFLKTDATETAHITYTCRLFAVSNPEVGFRVIENGRLVFQSPACADLRDRIAEIWGRALAEDLIPVEASDQAKGFSLRGLTARPGVGRSTRRELVTLVNKRPVDSRTLGFAVLDAYHGRLQKGRYPPAFLFLGTRAQDVDVNVHPAKREVRFREESEIRRFVLGTISETLRKYREPSAQAESPAAASSPTTPRPSISTVPPPSNQQSSPSPVQHPSPRGSTDGTPPRERSETSKPAVSVEVPTPSAPAARNPEEIEASKPLTSLSWHLIALPRKKYALFENQRGLVMLHLRHADQRVRFENIMKGKSLESTAARQSLLIAEPLELEPLASEALQSHLELLNARDFLIEPFGRNFFRIAAVPTWLPADQAEVFLRDLIDQLRQRGPSKQGDTILWERVARLAVSGSYRKSDPINETGAEALACQLLACEVPHLSPFGKPTYSEVTWSEWAKRLDSDT